MSTILVIEDDFHLLESVCEILSLEGYEVLSAENGRDGVALARQYLPNLILCDLSMPLLDGYGVIAELRADRRTAHIPITVLAGRVELRNRADEVGCDALLVKPFDIHQLMSHIHHWA